MKVELSKLLSFGGASVANSHIGDGVIHSRDKVQWLARGPLSTTSRRRPQTFIKTSLFFKDSNRIRILIGSMYL